MTFNDRIKKGDNYLLLALCSNKNILTESKYNDMYFNLESYDKSYVNMFLQNQLLYLGKIKASDRFSLTSLSMLGAFAILFDALKEEETEFGPEEKEEIGILKETFISFNNSLYELVSKREASYEKMIQMMMYGKLNVINDLNTLVFQKGSEKDKEIYIRKLNEILFKLLDSAFNSGDYEFANETTITMAAVLDSILKVTEDKPMYDAIVNQINSIKFEAYEIAKNIGNQAVINILVEDSREQTQRQKKLDL